MYRLLALLTVAGFTTSAAYSQGTAWCYFNPAPECDQCGVCSAAGGQEDNPANGIPGGGPDQSDGGNDNYGQPAGGSSNTPARAPMATGTASFGSARIPSGMDLPVKYTSTMFGGHDVGTGKPEVHQTDMDYSSNGIFGLTVSRRWCGVSETFSDNTMERTMLGQGWMLNWEIRLEVGYPDDNYITPPILRDHNGGAIYFGIVNGNVYRADPGIMAASIERFPNNDPTQEYYLMKIAGGDGIYRFNYYGHLVYIEDRNGNRVTCTYDDFSSTSLLTRVSASAPDDRDLDFAYHSPEDPADKRTSRLQSITCSWHGRGVTYVYTPDSKFLAEVKDNWNRTLWTFANLENYFELAKCYFQINARDANGNLGRVRLYEFLGADFNSQVIGTYDQSGTKLVYYYAGIVRDAAGAGVDVGPYTRHMRVPNQITEVSFASDGGSPTVGRTDTQTVRDSPIMGMGRDITRLPTTHRRGNGTTETYTYWGNYSASKLDWSFTRVQSATKPGQPTTYYFWDDATSRSAGWIQEYPGRWGGQYYDNKGNVTAVTKNGDIQTTYVLDTYGRLTQKVSRTGTTTYRHDNRGHIREVVDEEGRSTLYDYNSRDLRTAVGSLGTTTTYAYDSYDRLTTVTDHNQNKTLYAYDANDRATTWTDALGNSTTFQYSPTTYTLSSLTRADGGRIAFTYDLFGNRTSLLDQRDKLTTYSYDSKGRLTSERNSLGKTWTFTYDDVGGGGCSSCGSSGAGHAAAETDPAGRTTYMLYDEADRLTTVTYSGTTDLVVHGYDQYGRCVKSSDSRLPVTIFGGQDYLYSYNADDRLTTVTYPDGAAIGYMYDTSGRVAGLRDPDGNVTTYSFENEQSSKQLASINHSLLGGINYGYNSKGQLELEEYPNYTSNWWQYDAANRVSTLGHSDSFNNDFAVESYSFNAASLRTHVDYGTTPMPNDVYRRLWSYDKALRLTTEETQGNGQPGPIKYRHTYNYDPAGNRTTFESHNGTTTHTTTYGYNEANQLTSRDINGTVRDVYYDDNGNQILDLHGLIGKYYSHNRENMLTETGDVDFGVVPADISPAVSYIYDYSGQLLARSWPDGRIEKYYYDDINLLAVRESAGTGAWRTKRVNLLSQDRKGQLLAARHYSAWTGTVPIAHADHYYHYSKDGSATAVTASNGSLLMQLERQAFGLISSMVAQLFTGKEYDASAMLYYFNLRWYAPEDGRFLEVDPRSPALEPYVYAANNPVLYFDPTGGCNVMDIADRAKETQDNVGTTTKDGKGIKQGEECFECKDKEGNYVDCFDCCRGKNPLTKPGVGVGGASVENRSAGQGIAEGECFQKCEELRNNLPNPPTKIGRIPKPRSRRR